MIFRLFFRVEVRGEMRVTDKALVVANHQSFLDGMLLGAFLPVMPVWLLHSTIASRWYFKLPMRIFPHLVTDTASPWAIKAMVGLVEQGRPVMIFPEGRITVTGSMMKIYDGPAFVAAKTGAAVVPVHIDGAVLTPVSRMSGDFPRRWFPKITLTIHEPRRIPMPEARTARQRRRMAAERLRRIMQETAMASRRRRTLWEALLESVALHGRGRKMMEDIRARQESYGHILKTALALGRIVSKLAAEGEYAGVLMPNATTTVSLIFGMSAMRRVPAMLNYTAGAEGMESACRLAGIRVVITSRAFLERARLSAAVEKLRGVRVVCLEDLRAGFGFWDKLWLMGWALRFPRRSVPQARPDEPAVVLYTSGSEGRPKGVVLSHDSLLANIAQMTAAVEFSSRDKILGALPLFHAFGLAVGAILPMVTGARVYLYPSPLHYRMVPEMIYDRDCTVVFGTSAFLGKYAQAAHPYDFRSVRLLVSGADKLSDEVRAVYMERFGLRILEGYGVTECSPVISVNAPLAYKAGSVGEPLPGVEIRVTPVEGIEAGGVLHVKGPNLMLGYLKPDRPGEIEPAGEWYETGDVVTVDAAGFVTITSRLKRFAKVAGEMVPLELAERIASAASPARQHASVARAEAGRGETVLLFTEDPELKRDRLVAAARALGLPELAIPRRIFTVDKLPVLGNGKRDYVTLSQMARERE